MKLLLSMVLVAGLSADLLLADRLLNFSGNGWLSDTESAGGEYDISLQILNDGRGLHYHWHYLGEHGQQSTRNCIYLLEYFGGTVEVLAPSDVESCLDIDSYQSVGWGHSLRDDKEHEFLLSYRSDKGGRFTVSIRQDLASERLRVTGHYLSNDSLAQHWVDHLRFVH